jgi:hypothetical protein
LFAIEWAKAFSATSGLWLVSSATQSRNVERNPWTVTLYPSLRSSIDIAMFDKGLPFLEKR